MILINLLPHREAARKRRREVFFATLGAAALTGLLISFAIYSWYGNGGSPLALCSTHVGQTSTNHP